MPKLPLTKRIFRKRIMADVPLPRPGPLGLIQYAGVDMQEHFAASPASPVPDGWVMVPREPTPEMLAVVRNGPMHETWTEGYCAMIAASPAAPVVREPVIDEMDAVASKYAHKMALDLECVLSDYSGKWWDAAMQTLGEYRSAMNAIHERESPTHMGEPVLPQHGITGGGNG